MGHSRRTRLLIAALFGCAAVANGQTTATKPTPMPSTADATRGGTTTGGSSSDTSAPDPDKSIEEVVYTGPLPQDCISPDVKYTSEVLTDFIPVYREARQCQQACQAHGECYFWTWNEGQAGALKTVPEEGEEIELLIPEYSEEDRQRRMLAFADYTPKQQQRRMRRLKAPTADEVLADPPAGACFLFGPYVKTSKVEMMISGPRTCADECSALYSANCKYSRCCSRATATCVSKDSFFAQCRLPTDACPGRGWNCYNITSTPLGCLEYDTEYAPDVFGNDLEEILDVPTELHCQELCKNHEKCNYWSYNPWYKHMCLLKKKNRPKRSAKGIISGTKECAGFSQPELLYYIEEAPEYSTFYALLQKADLIDYVEEKTAGATNGTGGMTMIIPTNRAFEALPTTIERKLKNNNALLKKLMLYHMVDKPIWIERTIGDKTFTSIKSASGEDIGLSRRASAGGALRINDADVLILDLRTKNGLISLVTEVLIPPSLAEDADASLDSLNGKVSGQGIASLFEEDEVAETTAAATTRAPRTTTSRPRVEATTTPTTTTPRTTTEAPRSTARVQETVAPTRSPSTAAPSGPITIDRDASTIMDNVDVSRPTATPEGAMPTLGDTPTAEPRDRSNVEVSSRDLPGVLSGQVENDSGAEGEFDMAGDDSSSNGLLGAGVAIDVVALILIIALVLAAGIGGFLLFKRKQNQGKAMDEEIAVHQSGAPRVDYASR